MSTQRDYEDYANKLTEPHRLTEWQLLRCVIIAVAFIVVMLTIVWSASAQNLEQDGGSLAPPVAVQPGGMDHASQPRPSTGTRSRSKVFALTTASYAGLATADWFYSSKCIQHTATCSEQNPLYRRVSQSPVAFALAKGAMTSGTIYAAWKLHAKHPRAAWVVLGALTGLQAVVVSHNAQVVR